MPNMGTGRLRLLLCSTYHDITEGVEIPPRSRHNSPSELSPHVRVAFSSEGGHAVSVVMWDFPFQADFVPIRGMDDIQFKQWADRCGIKIGGKYRIDLNRVLSEVASYVALEASRRPSGQNCKRKQQQVLTAISHLRDLIAPAMLSDRGVLDPRDEAIFRISRKTEAPIEDLRFETKVCLRLFEEATRASMFRDRGRPTDFGLGRLLHAMKTLPGARDADATELVSFAAALAHHVSEHGPVALAETNLDDRERLVACHALQAFGTNVVERIGEIMTRSRRQRPAAKKQKSDD